MNKKQTLIVVLSTVFLGGCNIINSQSPGYGNSASPALSVVGGSIRLDQEVLVFQSAPGKPIAITWKLGPDAGYKFAERGIVIEGRLTDEVLRGEKPSVVLDPKQDEIVDCKPLDNTGLAFTCTNKRSRPGLYKYSIRLTDGKSELVRDPEIANW